MASQVFVDLSMVDDLLTGSDRSDRSGEGGRPADRQTTADHLR